ncbi:MAG: sterol desaturase family protein [Calothrix sp. MO_167.B42]|nr:sterol desaturase family protein [Calothrix sp. MO_167.B42]
MTEILSHWGMIFISGAMLSVWEKKDPLRTIEYKSELIKEFGVALISFLYTFINAYFVLTILTKLLSFPANIIASTGISSLPIWVKIIIAFVLKEFTYYIIHRIQHTNKSLWLTHKWHHSSQSLWWLVAQRVSFSSAFLYIIPSIWISLLGMPPGVIIGISLYSAFQDNWIHLNVKSQPWMKILEWVYVTPRFHGLHHYNSEGKNLGDSLTIFDRLFGTYLDPDTYDLDENQSAGIDEPITVRMIVGV